VKLLRMSFARLLRRCYVLVSSVARKPFVPAKDSRAKRKHRKKRCHKSSVVSADKFQSRMRAL